MKTDQGPAHPSNKLGTIQPQAEAKVNVDKDEDEILDQLKMKHHHSDYTPHYKELKGEYFEYLGIRHRNHLKSGMKRSSTSR